MLGLEQPEPAGTPTDRLMARFERYLLLERGLAAGTVRGYLTHARRFLDGLASAELDGLTAADVTGAVLDKAASGVSVSAAQYFVSALRAFLRFCFLEGLAQADLAQAALQVGGRRSSPLPRGLGRADARALLDACDRPTAQGRGRRPATR